MIASHFNHVRLSAICCVVPKEEIRLQDELKYYGNSLDKAHRFAEVSGFESRRVAPEGVTASDLCAQAAERLLMQRTVPRDSIDAIIFVSESPDYTVPATASLLQDRLKLTRHCAAFDMTAACSGYIHGLWVAAGLIESSSCRRVLLLAGNTVGRFLDPANRVISPIFGDAGSATLLEYCDTPTPMSFSLGNDGSRDELFIAPGGGARIPAQGSDPSNNHFNRVVMDPKGNPWTLGGYAPYWMNGMELFSAVVTIIPKHIREHLNELELTAADLDGLVLHQGNRMMVETIAKKVGVPPEKAPWATLSRYGNQMCASLPAVLCDQFESKISALNPSRIMLCAFGAGISWGSCVLEMAETFLCGIHDYQNEESVRTREEHIAYWHTIFQGDNND